MTLKGFRPGAFEKLNFLLKPPALFIRSVCLYVVRRAGKFGVFIVFCSVGAKDFVLWSKSYIVRKLIWSRGRLGRPIANLIVLCIAFMVFTFGEVLNSTRFVNSQEISPDYLSNVTDIIPNRNVATTLVPDDRKRAESFVYIIRGGDTLSSVGEKFKISTSALEYVNGLTDYSILTVGDSITIPPISGLIHTVEDGDTLASIAEKYDVATQAVADFNYILDTSVLVVGAELVIPGATVPIPVYIPPTAPAWVPSGMAGAPSSAGFVWPTSASIITQYFTWYHHGIDIAIPWNTGMPPVFASAGGTVIRAGWNPWGLGLHIAVDHGDGFETVYGHLSRIDVGYGQRVHQGKVIGYMGNTGRSTGPHLHFGVKYSGIAQDPSRYVR